MMPGTRIRELRLASGYRQTDLADAVGCTAQVISNIERGVSGVSADLAARIASALHVPISEVMPKENLSSACLSEDEMSLLTKYRQLSPDERQLLLDMFNLAVDRRK